MAEIMPHWLKKQAELKPDHIAIQEEKGKAWTFSELDKASRRFANGLMAEGVQAEDKIAILSGNCTEFIITVHAASYIGAIVVLLNTRLSESEIAYQLHDAGVSLVLADTENEKATQGHVWRTDCRTVLFSHISDNRKSEMPLVEEINLDDGFTIMYTSGTTGMPKAVMHTYGNHWWSAMGSMLNIGLTEDDKWLSVLPIFHIGGLSIYFKSTIYGMPVYMLSKFDEASVLDAIQSHGVTIMSAVSVMLRRLLDLLGDDCFPTTFRCMLLGGGPAPRNLLEESQERGIPVFQSYGMTETSSQIVTLGPGEALTKLGSSGKPLFPAQLKIDRPDSKGEGEIVVKGPMVVNGYYRNADATSNAFTADGWLHTGDIGRLDQDGSLYVLDRRKDLIISGGENVYPAEIESVLSSCEGVSEAGVTGIKDAKWGEVPIAFIVSDPFNSTVIKSYCEEHLASYKCPKYIWRVDALPRNASGKLVRNTLSAWAVEKVEQTRNL